MSDEAMGTTFALVLYGRDRARLEESGRAALAEAARLDNLLSNYKPDSEWSAMNREAGRRPFTVSAELFDLLSACAEYTRVTDGAFDISVGPLLKAWGFFKGEGAMPPPDVIRRALADVGSAFVRLDASTRTVSFARPGAELDPGGIGKGYAVDRMVAMLRAHGVSSAFVSSGGSSLYGLGAPPGEPRGWAAPIRHPHDSSRTAAEVFLRDASLSTSGSYEKFFRAGGAVYSHIMDPRTGFPARGSSSVSVIAPRTIDSEAWTKAYFVNGRAWAAAHVRPGTRVLMCDDSDQAACRWLQ
jgi:thiamine biosynthesis lipoprotein